MYKLIQAVIFLATIVTMSSAQVTGWTNCGSPMAYIQHVYLTGCVQAPCTVPRGTPHEISFEAIANHGNDRLNYRVTASILGLPITLHEGTACYSIFYGTCPINAGDRFRLGLLFTPGHDLPQITSIIQIRVFSNHGENNGPDDVCFTLPVRIVASNANLIE